MTIAPATAADAPMALRRVGVRRSGVRNRETPQWGSVGPESVTEKRRAHQKDRGFSTRCHNNSPHVIDRVYFTQHRRACIQTPDHHGALRSLHQETLELTFAHLHGSSGKLELDEKGSRSPSWVLSWRTQRS